VPVAAVVATVGATIDAFASPNVAATFDHVNVGVALSTVSVAVVDAPLRFAESVGANVAVITDEPAPVTVTVDPDTVATAVVADEYDHVPATALPAKVTAGDVNANVESPNVLPATANEPSVGVALSTVTVIVTVPPET
jgi:hypothetical protein